MEATRLGIIRRWTLPPNSIKPALCPEPGRALKLRPTGAVT